MKISKVLVPFVTLSISAAIGGNYIWEIQKNEGTDIDNLSDVIKTKKSHTTQSLKIGSEADDKKDIKWKLLFSIQYKNEDGVLYFFYSGNLLTYENYKEKEKVFIAKKKTLKGKGRGYTGKIDFDISENIEEEKAEAYLKKENDKLGSKFSLKSSSPYDAFELLQIDIRSNETEFKKIFGNDVYEDLLAWNWTWK